MRGFSANAASYRSGKGLGDLQASYNAASNTGAQPFDLNLPATPPNGADPKGDT